MTMPFRYRSALFSVVLVTGLLMALGCQQKPQGPPQMPPPEVVVETVKTEPIVLTTELPGRTTARLVADIRPQVNGLILHRFFTEGSDVKAGDPLYQIDPAPFQAALDSAKASLSRSEANLPAIRAKAKRLADLAEVQAVSRQDADDAASALKQVEADIQYWKAMVNTATIQLNYTVIKAPISGRVGKSTVTEGQLVTAYQPLALATIQQLDPIYVDVPQSTADLLRLKKRMEEGRLIRNGQGQNTVRLILEDGSTYTRTGAIQFQDVTVDPTTGSVTLRILFPNPDAILLPGMFVRAVVIEGKNDAAILVPQQAVMRDPKGNPYALVLTDDGKTRVAPVVIDRCMADKWFISSGLKPGDRIVVEGLQRARPGMPVRVAQQQGVSSGSKSDTPAQQQQASTAGPTPSK